MAADLEVSEETVQAYWDAKDALDRERIFALSCKAILDPFERAELEEATTILSDENATAAENVLVEEAMRSSQASVRLRQVMQWLSEDADLGDRLRQALGQRQIVARRSRSDWVYYVQRERDGQIKIGYTRRLRERIGQLRTEFGPLTVLATHGGGYWAEQAQHRRFASLRRRGEWFEPAPDLLDHIAHLTVKQRRRDTRAEYLAS